MPHIHDLIDFTAEVFVVYKNKVLLRRHEKYDIWLGVGGHVELDEDPNQAAIREVKEEVGLDVVLDDSLLPFKENIPNHYSELIPPYFLDRNRVGDTHEHVTMIYFARSNSYEIVEEIELEKSLDIGWFTKEEVENKKELKRNIRFYALKALEVLSA